jgi:uncharacterized metal-binding protein YceD (DUF177 family)
VDDTFKIFVHRLKDGHQEKIVESLSADFLDIHEAGVAFKSPVNLKGSAAVTDDMLVLLLTVETEATLPCAICNQDVQVKISIPDLCHTERLADIKGGVFDYREVLREGILLELPYTAECNDGDCPERADLAKYFTNNSHSV